MVLVLFKSESWSESDNTMLIRRLKRCVAPLSSSDSIASGTVANADARVDWLGRGNAVGTTETKRGSRRFRALCDLLGRGNAVGTMETEGGLTRCRALVVMDTGMSPRHGSWGQVRIVRGNPGVIP